MKIDKILEQLESLAKLAELLKPLLSKLPADTLSKLVSAAVQAVDKLGADALAGKAQEAIDKYIAKEAAAPGGRAPMECVHATCWNGENASQRYMNMLSPAMSDDKFQSYLAAMKERGCDTVHLLLMNKADGENAGYSIYGTGGTGSVDAGVVKHMLGRLAKFRKNGFRIVLWGVADDSNDWAAAMLDHAAQYAADLRDSGILDYADLFVLGLEMDEYGSSSGWKAFAAAIAGVAPGLYLATHHTSGKYTYAALGSGVMGQLAKECTAKQIASQIATIQKKGKDAWGFEYARSPDREKAQAALDAGAIGVGNW